MKFIFTKHAKERMLERNISEEEIEEVMEFPDYSVRKQNIIESIKRFKDRELKIVYLKEGKFIKIITVIER
jgi:predicted transcriptional regulator